jgi:predicted nucleic acid-binding protein
VILVDANLLVYTYVATFPQHEDARTWMDDRLNGTAPVGLPRPSILSYMRFVTHARIFERHREVLKTLLADQSLRANLIPDTHLAALAIEHGLTLCSTDGDFVRFPGLQWSNPLS